MKLEIEFIEKKKEADNSYLFIFKKPEGLEWRSGQHAMFKLKKDIVDSKGYRVFTISSSKRESILSFATKISETPSLFKQELMNLKKGDKVKFDGPYGYFHINKNSNTYVGIAGGIGVTPFRSIIHDLANDDKFKDVKIELVYVARQNNYIFKNELDSFAKNKNIIIHYANDRGVAQQIIKELQDKYQNDADYYIAGSPEMVHFFKEFLKEKEVAVDNIRCDNFEGY